MNSVKTAPRVVTARLNLVRITPEVEGDIAAILSDPKVMYAWEHGFTQSECKEWFGRQYARYAQGQEGLFAAVLRKTGQVIGYCGITAQDISGYTPLGGEAADNAGFGEKCDVWEIGYALAKEFWHRGYAIEAARACKLLSAALGIQKVYSIIRTNNLPSICVVERNGMRPVGITVKHYRGKEMPHIIFCANNFD